MDDKFAIFTDDKDRDEFLLKLNSMHANLEFTMEIATENNLAFLDVMVNRENQKFYTNIYRKSTFSGDYVPYNSYSPMRQKLNLISLFAINFFNYVRHKFYSYF